ncbi:unnamed protein product [Paramecium primaurelia]|uniref:Uncharacterized protein n=2 Tax=Paramecium TaxID=5884 RepID=A0A8S1WXW3_9CILI|nr:unnamed protein product [Paramecium primaurelia]CAD8190696.1 unnamed protein product [Paramecium pentaurelia]
MRPGEVFEKFISQAPDFVPQKNQSYTLQEDLKIMLALKDISIVQSKNFRDIEESQIVKRTYNSIKNRYMDYLQYLSQENMEQIAQHLNEHGLVGYLLFSNSQPRELLKIVNFDPKTMEKEKKKVEDELEINKLQKVKVEHKKQIDPTFPKNDFDKFSIEDMDQVLSLLSDYKGVPKAYLVERLHQLSGNLEDLDGFLKTNDDTYCFLEEEDHLLKEDQNKESPAIRLLIRKKGISRVQRRLKYLGK